MKYWFTYKSWEEANEAAQASQDCIEYAKKKVQLVESLPEMPGFCKAIGIAGLLLSFYTVGVSILVSAYFVNKYILSHLDGLGTLKILYPGSGGMLGELAHYHIGGLAANVVAMAAESSAAGFIFFLLLKPFIFLIRAEIALCIPSYLVSKYKSAWNKTINAFSEQKMIAEMDMSMYEEQYAA